MNYHALIPVKKLTHAKSRLSKEMSEKARSELVLSMLKHVISVLTSCQDITKIIVVTTDEKVSKFALSLHVSVEAEKIEGHNPALTSAAKKEDKEEIDGLLTISADLPLLTQDDIQKMLEFSILYDVVLAPSNDNGTNAIVLKKPLLLPYRFGKNSFEKYKDEALKREIEFVIYQNPTISFDVDTIDDVNELNKQKNNSSYKFITRIKEIKCKLK